ncbi:MAG: glycosyltransferase family 4 protein [candidate division KSB1 bacterium]|nr:glycosyltransferase family 4 protein [candidate division KSB1 bacterium]
MLRLLYFSNERFPTRDAVSIQQMHVAESFARLGVDLTFVRPWFHDMAGYHSDDIFLFYGIETPFNMRILPSALSLSKPRYGIDIGYHKTARDRKLLPGIGGASVILSTGAFIYSQITDHAFDEPTAIYSRNLNSTAVFLKHKRLLQKKPVRVFIEAHALSQEPERLFRSVVCRCDGIVSITQALKQDLVQEFNLDPGRIHVAPDGVRQVDHTVADKQALRRQLSIPHPEKNLVVYSGGFSRGKGAEIVVRAAEFADSETQFYLLGGAPRTIAELRRMTRADQYDNVHLPGFVPPRVVGDYQAAADVLVLPNTPDYALRDYTSPLKLFEYMAAGSPVVASDLPVFREVLDDGRNGVLVKPGSPQHLAAGIRKALDNPSFAAQLARTAKQQVSAYTYPTRARGIFEFIRRQTGWKIPNKRSV